MPSQKQLISPERYEAVLFDLDGVVTRTASVHAAAWKVLFDEFLEERSGSEQVTPFDIKTDYTAHVDGKPRIKGIIDFLNSRGIDLPAGDASDTLSGLGKKKNRLFLDLLEKQGIKVYDTTVDLIRNLRKNGFKIAVVSSSKNCGRILKAAGIEELFDTRVDGKTAEKLGLAGKPEPDTFIEAAQRLGVDMPHCVVVEDSLSGTAAGKKGGAGMIIGVDRAGQAEKFKQNGADLVVDDLAGVKAGRATTRDKSWEKVYTGFNPKDEGRRETLCALGNGYLVTRGSVSEALADGIHYPGTYLAGGYNRLKTRINDKTVENEDLVNLPNWLSLNFRLPKEPWFRLEDVTLLFYRQCLNMKKGILTRILRFQDRKNRQTLVVQQSFVHGEKMHLAGLKTKITPLNWRGDIQICSALDSRVANLGVERYRKLGTRHFDLVSAAHLDENRMLLKVRTKTSCLEIAMGARTVLDDKHQGGIIVPIQAPTGYLAKHFTAQVSKGRPLVVEKLVSIYTSRDPGILECAVEANNAIAGDVPGFDDLLFSHTGAWKMLWREFDFRLALNHRAVEQHTQKIIRLYIFHLLQSSSFHSLDIDVGMPARGWHGEGYRGHIFWDEMIIFPFLNYRAPRITRTLLLYRYRRLGRAQRAAREAGFLGAMYPWQSGSNGREETQQLHLNPVSGRWIKDNTHLQRHVNTAIVYNIWQYFQITDDVQFLSFYGGEIIVEVARFWASAATYDPQIDRYEICGVMGPDEFHDACPGAGTPGLRNNAYTNIMVMFVMDQALNLQHILPWEDWESLREKRSIQNEELVLWGKMSRRMKILFHGDGIISQFEGYENLNEFNWEGYKQTYGDIRRLDRILEKEGDSPNNYQLSKQPDVLMLFYLFSAETLKKMFKRLDYPLDKNFIRKNINYYLHRTTNGSSLALIIHAWIEARQARARSWKLFSRALETDMVEDRAGSIREGIHLAAMSGCIDILQRGYAGLEARSDILILNPLLPKSINRIQFHIRYRKHWLDIEITQSTVTVKSMTGKAVPFTMMIKDEIIKLYPGNTAIVEI